MVWLVAIIVIILCLVFWRQSLVLLGIAAIALVLIFLNIERADRDRARERAAEAERTRAVIAEARQKVKDAQTSLVPKEWQVLTKTDPASGQKVPRSARVESDDGLCTMTVEERIDRTRLTDISCTGLNLNYGAYSDDTIEIKFDNRAKADRMKIKAYSNTSWSAYIPSSQPTYSDYLEYDAFLIRLGSADKVALQLNFKYAGGQWVTFSLNYSREALAAIGAL